LLSGIEIESTVPIKKSFSLSTPLIFKLTTGLLSPELKSRKFIIKLGVSVFDSKHISSGSQDDKKNKIKTPRK
jgi:hypothetical protein